MYRAIIAFVCNLTVCVASAQSPLGIPLENLINASRPDYKLIPLDVVPLMRRAYEADRGPDIDLELAIELYGVVANNGALDPSVRTFCLANMAYCMERMNRYREAIQALDRIRVLNPEVSEVSFWTDYEIARAMADTGGHSLIPDFDPSENEKKARFDILFNRHIDPRMELIAAHKKAAQEYRIAGQTNGEYFSYAIQELQKGLALMEVLIEEGKYTKSDEEREAEYKYLTESLEFLKFLQLDYKAQEAKTLDSSVNEVFASLSAPPVTDIGAVDYLSVAQSTVISEDKSMPEVQSIDTNASNRNFLVKAIGFVLVLAGFAVLRMKVKGWKSSA